MFFGLFFENPRKPQEQQPHDSTATDKLGRQGMLSRALAWVATGPATRDRHAGFQVNNDKSKIGKPTPTLFKEVVF